MCVIYGRFVDLVLEARQIHEDNLSLSRGSVVNVNPDFLQIVTAFTDKAVAIKRLDTESRKVAAIVLQKVYNGPVNLFLQPCTMSEEILLSNTLTACWKRFAACKELVHIYLRHGREAERGEESIDITLDSLRGKLVSISGDFWGLKKEDDLDEERYALYLAVEIMLPWSKRDKLHEMKEQKLTHYKIAEKFKVPEAVIDMYFAPESGYKNLSVESNTDLVLKVD